jgi:hypothetical protein
MKCSSESRSDKTEVALVQNGQMLDVAFRLPDGVSKLAFGLYRYEAWISDNPLI